MWTEPDIQSGQNFVWAEVLKSPPITLAPVVGDCLHNLRSALDNLAFELAVAYKGAKMSKSIADDSAFPIYKTGSSFTKYGKSKIRGMHPDARTLVERLQPYNRGNKPVATSTLWCLAELSNSDKHRLPHLAVAVLEQLTLTSSSPYAFTTAEFSTEPFEDRAVIAKFRVPFGTYTEVDMQRPPTFGIAFGERSPDVVQAWGVVKMLTHLSRFVNEIVVPPLVKYLA